MKVSILKHIRIVLVNPSHPGNIGAVARAMKNMAIEQLVLISPLRFPHVDATARAAGADDILAKASVVETLDVALEGCGLVVGTSARTRSLPWPLLDSRECAVQVVQSLVDRPQSVAVVFGCEQSGLSNEQLAKCHYHLHVPTQADFASLNLAAAVQVVVYELYMAQRSFLENEKKNEGDVNNKNNNVADEQDTLSTAEEMVSFYKHLQRVLFEIDFLKPTHSRRLMLRLKRLFNRARVEKREVNILRGILTAISEKHR